ncbi:hypothetical protein GCM10009795_014770 [Nocardioides hankookensis]|uniref:Methanol dehydrogenase n=1 Tax=Nocardioides hankookensis TaxID=443157 RepID=A0ABW1LK91_9ACTN
MIVLIVIGIFVAVMVVYAFWPRADGLGSRVNRASTIAHGKAGNYDNDGGGGSGGGGGL